jgi:FG-GAP-like repeat
MALNIGDVIFNEFVSDNTTVSTLSTSNDYFELLVLTNNSDLRGLRVSDNEITPTSNNGLNFGEAVYIFGQDPFLASVAKGTIIAVYTNPAASSIIVSDTTASAAAGDWKLVLQDGAGITISTDGVGGTVNPGLSTTGEGLYLYLPGPDGNSGGTDNIYLDYISFGTDSAEAPNGLVDLNLPDSGGTIAPTPPGGTPFTTPQADEGYYIGNTAAGNDLAANWVTYDVGAAGAPNTIATPGEANTGQDLSSLRVITPATQPVRNDFNGDGKSDLLWRSTGGDTYIYHLNSFSVSPEGSVRNVTTDWNVAGTGDFNSDGKSDIVWRNSNSGEAYIYQQNGLTVIAEGSLGLIPANITISAVADFNGDGISEILCRDNSNGNVLLSNVNGFSLSPASVVRNVSLDWQIAGTGDFNGDNNADVLWRNSNTGDVYTYLMNGTAVIGEGIVRNAVTSDWAIEGVDDFDGNGKDDILWRNSNSGTVYGYLMDGISIASEGVIGTVPVASGWDISGTGDINGDSKGDVLWRNSGSGDVYAWELNGLSVLNENFIRQGVSNSYQIVSPTI